ncbi:MAG: carboxypeptidase regulatory-like domain-containing protein [Acidobacteriota bacterium]|jgi:hypothetical protein|nr:carboxypeptidase regulatory-like domain-containing protein [Acidobacteriota bacterium]
MKKICGKHLLSILTLVLCLFLFSNNNLAQDLDDVVIGGKVTDQNGAIVIGATVTAILVEKGIERSAKTDENGRYQIIELSPGKYSIRVNGSGFGIETKTDLDTISGQSIKLDFSLVPESIRAEQTVSFDDTDAPVIDPNRTIVGGTITQREIEELPNNSRDPYNLVLTLGGTAEEALSTRDLADDRNVTNATAPAEQGNFSLSGGASYSNNITIDGLDNNDDRSANIRFQPSLESIAEVQVVTNQFSAEYGRASGGRINLRTKSGANRLRGRIFMFFRDDNLNANTYYNNSRGFERLPLREYNPGFTLSGPVVLPKIYNGRNRTFFSIAYEYNNLQDK